MATTLYDTLGVSKNASADEIKKAYRKLAREHHPDQGGDESRFKEIQGAYDVLSDPEKRTAYDTWGSTNGRGAAGPQFQGNVDFGEFGDLSDLFGGLFGGRGRGRGAQPSRQPERGADVEAHVSLSFDDSLAGAEVRVPVELETACHTCAGSGAEPGTAPTVCPQCGGRGVTADSHGLFALSQPCPRCRGNGTIVEHPCPTCRGTGRERTTKRYTVKVPAGAKDGTRIRLKGRGEAGRNGGPAGDLWVVTRVAPSETYERRGSDLIVDVPVSYPQAALGASIDVPTPDGTISLRVPAGSQHGKLLKVKGRGAPKLKGGGKGDLLARLKLTVPQKVSKRERELLEELRKVGG
jgi:molecular chaperone DnaJ